MATVHQLPLGHWYLAVTCKHCHCKILLFPDLNDGQGRVIGFYEVTCPRCQQKESLPVEHYRHSNANPNCVEWLKPQGQD